MGQEQKELTDSHFALGFWQETRVLSTPPPPLEETFLHVTGSNPAYFNPRLVQLNLEFICPADGKSLGHYQRKKPGGNMEAGCLEMPMHVGSWRRCRCKGLRSIALAEGMGFFWQRLDGKGGYNEEGRCRGLFCSWS